MRSLDLCVFFLHLLHSVSLLVTPTHFSPLQLPSQSSCRPERGGGRGVWFVSFISYQARLLDRNGPAELCASVWRIEFSVSLPLIGSQQGWQGFYDKHTVKCCGQRT